MDNNEKKVYTLSWHIWDMPDVEAIHVTEYRSLDKNGQPRVVHITITIGDMPVPTKHVYYLYDLLQNYRQMRENMGCVISELEFMRLRAKLASSPGSTNMDKHSAKPTIFEFVDNYLTRTARV